MSKKGENIYKRKDGRWEARYIKEYAPNGAAKYGYCYGKTYREAKERVNGARCAEVDSLKCNKAAARRNISLCCDEWLRLKRSAVKQSTYGKYLTAVEKHIKPNIGELSVAEVDSFTAEQLGYDLIHKSGLSAKTVKDILTVFHAVLRYAEKQTPHLREVEIIYPKVEKREIRVLSREEQEKLMLYLNDGSDLCKFGALLALLTGLRIGELCALRWRDISVKEELLRVRATMQRIKNPDGYESGGKTEIVISDPKSFSSSRIIPLSPLALKLCVHFYGKPDAFILTGRESSYIEPRVMQYRMSRYAADCGLEDIHFHTLRHSFATRCVEVGFEIKSLSEILGHACPQITLERYVHSSIKLKKENMLKLACIGC